MWIRIILQTLLSASLLFAATLAAGANKRPTITFSCSLAPDMSASKRLTSYYREAFAKLGYSFQMLYRPPKRSLVEAINGTSDGECARITHFFAPSSLANLEVIHVVVGTATVNLWGRHSQPLSDVNLHNPKVVIGVIAKGRIANYLLNQINHDTPKLAPQKFTVNSYKTGLRMLTYGRINYFIGVNALVSHAQQKNHLQGKVFNLGRLQQVEASPLLNLRHKAIAADFTRELQAIVDKRGVIQTY